METGNQSMGSPNRTNGAVPGAAPNGAETGLSPLFTKGSFYRDCSGE